jgi:hypothetical protein
MPMEFIASKTWERLIYEPLHSHFPFLFQPPSSSHLATGTDKPARPPAQAGRRAPAIAGGA